MGDLLDPSGATSSALAGWKPRRRFRECPVSLVQSLPERPTDQHFLPHRDHSRLFDQNLYIYPVLSRRSRGISVGINLNPDKVCNFDCVYCQVDRRRGQPRLRGRPQVTDVDEEQLLRELEETLELVLSGRLYLDQRFASVPDPLRRLNDIAFSGDGEPTTYPGFARIVRDVAAFKKWRRLDGVKLVLITNATRLHRPHVREALATLDASNGEIWAKLDAGTEAYYRTIDRTKIPLQRVLANILDAARARPVVIQSLLLCLNGQGPSELEVEAYCRRLGEIVAAGGQIARVQLYTVARTPAVAEVGPLPNEELERLGEIIRRRVGITVDIYNAAMAVP
jgi:wyosine [tRNA(Phe)-imidazoG37] synthetase (radical SAM superfamily)